MEMNEHIGMLAEQAGLLGPTSRIGNSHEATERFARLIVIECINVIRAQDVVEENVLDSWDRGFVSGLYTSIDALEEHFGVKE